VHEAFEAEHVARQSRRPLSLRLYRVSLFWLNDMEGLFAYYSKLSTSVDATDFGNLQTVYRVAQKTGPIGPYPI